MAKIVVYHLSHTQISPLLMFFPMFSDVVLPKKYGKNKKNIYIYIFYITTGEFHAAKSRIVLNNYGALIALLYIFYVYFYFVAFILVSGNSCDLLLAFSVGMLKDKVVHLVTLQGPPSCYKPSKLNFPKKKFSVIFLMTWAHIKIHKRIQCIGRKSLWSSSEFYLRTPFILSIHRQEQFVSLVCLSLNLLVFTNGTSVIMFILHIEMCKLSKRFEVNMFS